ncbi:uncharacterized protein LOC131854485 [Achroia grisella]|uniref:uncharacterized protein LOC131854485 n=1 Tax=Achroia grisella TaxID=688607 RepID=UPI0027D3372F|nr:uncharacterized protein LOC131854485 [Achroia grisella]
MTDEKGLIRKRGSFKGRLTSFSTYLNSLDVSSMSPTDVNELQLRIGKIELLYDQFDEVQLQLECIVENSDLQISERTEFESQYYKLLALGQKIQFDFSSTHDQHLNVNSEKCSRSGNNCKPVRLPIIEIKKYNGSYDTWIEFRDTFTSLIHSNDDIDPINKFHYLRASLEGTAAVVIQSFEFSSKNYEIAWQLLCERFDNKRLLLQNHVSALFNIEPVTKESSTVLKRVVDQVNKNLRALESLGEPVKHWDTLLIHIVIHKLDSKSYREWEELKSNLDKNKPITFNDFITFLRNRADLLESLELSRNVSTSNQPSQYIKPTSKCKSMVSVQNNNIVPMVCPKCNGDHSLGNCHQFLSLSNNERFQLLPNYKVCYNCFRKGHFANHCKKPGCKVCKRKHNTLVHVVDLKSVLNNETLHSDVCSTSETSRPVVRIRDESNIPISLSANVADMNRGGQEVLLSTALVKVYDIHNREHVARAVLDSGSTSCLMTEKMYSQLNLSTINVNKSVIGINNVSSHVGKMCRVSMKSLNNSFSVNINCYILPSITDNVPSSQINLTDLKLPSNIHLADPKFHSPSAVDLILGADIFWDLIGLQQLKLGIDKPILHETKLGWVVSGPINCGYKSSSSHNIKCNFSSIHDETPTQLTQFCQFEQVCPQSSNYSVEEKLCEERFIKNITRLKDGRFCESIPLKQNSIMLSDSFQRAKYSFSIEHKKVNKPIFKIMYTDFISEYESLGHMTKCFNNNSDSVQYYFPCHRVLRESSPTSLSISYNNLQYVGPTIQKDLRSISLWFKQYKYIIDLCLENMYRQIIIHPEYRCIQSTLLHGDPFKPFKLYQLYIDLECKDDKICDIIIRDFNVADMLTGGDDIGEVKQIREQVSSALLSAVINLRKWKYSNPIPCDFNDTLVNLNIGMTDESSKTLSLWESGVKSKFKLKRVLGNCHLAYEELNTVLVQVKDVLNYRLPTLTASDPED